MALVLIARLLPIVSLGHIELRVVQGALITVGTSLLFEDEVEIADETVEVEALAVLYTVCVEQESLDCLKALPVACLVLVVVEAGVDPRNDLLL